MKKRALIFLLSLHGITYGSLPAHAEEIDPENPFAHVENEANAYEKRVLNQQKNEEARILQKWNDYKDQVLQKWKDGLIPEQKKYVMYDEDYLSRLRVNYEDGTVNVESLQDSTDQEAALKAKKAISEQLNRVNQKDQGAKLPVLDGSNKKITPEQIAVEETTEKGQDGIARKRFTYRFKLDSSALQKRINTVLPWVKEWTQKYGVDPSLVLAVIKQESAFNPRARSWVPAFGLMQIVAFYAGKDVMNYLEKKNTAPSEETLYDPRANILFGTTYLKILNDQFSSIKNATNRQYIVICSYNWGPGRLQKLIKQKKIIPEGDSQKLYDVLVELVPSETKGYLKNVTSNYELFKRSSQI